MATPSEQFAAGLESSKAEYVRLGKSGLRVSVPILGAMSFGSRETLPWTIERDEALPLLKAAYDRGLNTWDTANVYSNGVSESIIGEAIRHYSLPRSKLVILTKLNGCVMETLSDRGALLDGKLLAANKDYVNNFGLSRSAIFKALDESLRRLGTDYVDLLQIHRFDATVPPEETMEALHDLVKSGKVRYIGASSMWATQFATLQFVAEKNGWTKFVSMQNHYNLLYREEEREMIRFCNETGVGLIPWAPLAGGKLARRAEAHGTTVRSKGNELDEVERGIVERVGEVADKRGWTPSEVALAWVGKRVTSPIVGFSSVARIDEALGVRGKVLTEEEENYLEELYQPKKIVGHS
ncbi:hypothetical protein V496_09152 [Pseudogymnoascus sp. VKM F-4515 (FW-2607)]|nr:hypothetical protein V496_09152 [Pseudogymnoascus sp. VKM F-4515 (FW-2607)]KFY88190.1 hypothetical protein V498_06880 [Pseudogymnoascus sp. VKM F-4517 (FW-2822)]